jgi:hypothetical protein
MGVVPAVCKFCKYGGAAPESNMRDARADRGEVCDYPLLRAKEDVAALQPMDKGEAT